MRCRRCRHAPVGGSQLRVDGTTPAGVHGAVRDSLCTEPAPVRVGDGWIMINEGKLYGHALSHTCTHKLSPSCCFNCSLRTAWDKTYEVKYRLGIEADFSSFFAVTAIV